MSELFSITIVLFFVFSLYLLSQRNEVVSSTSRARIISGIDSDDEVLSFIDQVYDSGEIESELGLYTWFESENVEESGRLHNVFFCKYSAIIDKLKPRYGKPKYNGVWPSDEGFDSSSNAKKLRADSKAEKLCCWVLEHQIIKLELCHHDARTVLDIKLTVIKI
jgi:hypothetical protein